jgi:hypothetical protein
VTQEGDVDQPSAPSAPAASALGLAPGLGTPQGILEKVAPTSVARVGDAVLARSRQAADEWFVWFLALSSLAVPCIVLLCVESIPRDTVVWHSVRVSIDRGDFLVSALALCVETIRRWWRDVHPTRSLRFIRAFATVACVIASLISIVTMTDAASLPVTSQTGESVTVITCSCLVVGVIFGTFAVAASGRKARQ